MYILATETSVATVMSKIEAFDILAFAIPFLLAIFIDLGMHKKGKPVTMADAAMWSIIWLICAGCFGLYIYLHSGATAASLYAQGYILEKALAVDNLFAFYLIFKSFGLTQPANQHLQHRILYWGILGAIIFRIFF
jgi:tellurite resistance protein TerC